MRTLTLAVAFLVGAPLAVYADVSKEDLKKLCAAGLSDGLILSYARTHGPIAKLTADDLLELKQLGASETLLTGLLAAPEPSGTPTETVVAPPATSPVYSTYPSSTYPSTVVYGDAYPDTYAPYYSYYSPVYPYYCAPGVGFGFGLGFRDFDHRGFDRGRFNGGFRDGRIGGTRFSGGFSGHSGFGGSFSGGHAGFGGGHMGGGFGGGGHGGHR